MMHNHDTLRRKHIYILITCNALIAIASVLLVSFIMYTISLKENKTRLQELAQNQARIIESVSDFDLKHQVDFNENITEEDAWTDTLYQLKTAHKNYKGFGTTGEFTLAKRVKDKIVFLLSHRHFDLDNPKPVDFNSNQAQPMKAALNMKSGVMIGYDYRGIKVIAAFEPVKVHIGNLGVVAKIDLEEIQKPFIVTTTIILLVIIVLISGVSWLFFRYINPIVKRHEESIKKLEYSEKLFSKSQEIAKIASWDLDFSTGFLNSSLAMNQIFEIDVDENLNSLEDLLYYIAQEDIIRIKKSIEKAKVTASFNERFKVKTFHNELRYVHAIGEVIEHKLTAVIRDITEETMIEKALIEKEEMMISQSRQVAMGDMVAMIAHQWRQPITTVTMIVNNMISALTFDEKVDKEVLFNDMNKILHQTSYLSTTIDDFRSFFNPSNEKNRVSLCDILEDTLKIINKSLESHNIKVNTTFNACKKLEIFDKEMLQVFLVILNNAKDAIMDNKIEYGFIEIEIGASSNMVFIKFCDNAGGIPLTMLSKLGEPYLTTKVKHGTGLGLYMSKIIIENHMDGKIQWYNKENGACIEINIPVKSES